MEQSVSLTDTIIQTINSIFQTLFSSIDNSVYQILDELTFINSSILNDSLFEKLNSNIKAYLNNKINTLNLIKASYIFKNPSVLYIDKIYLYNDTIKKINNNMEKYLINKTNNYQTLLNKLEILNPITTLKRGYTITYNQDMTITSIKDVKVGDKIKSKLKDGFIESEVLNIHEQGKNPI